MQNNHKSWSAKSEKYNGVPLSWYTKQSSDYNEYYYLGKQKYCFKKRNMKTLQVVYVTGCEIKICTSILVIHTL
jgi:hypothetical protein